MTSLQPFFTDLGDDGSGGHRYLANASTGGPWSPSLQHGGPPSALLVHAMSALPGPPGRLARVTTEFHGAVPVGECLVRARVLRDGANIQLLTAELEARDRTVLTAAGWRLRTVDDPSAPATETAHGAPPPLPAPQPVPDFDFPYGEAVEWRFVSGAPRRPGPATAWARLRVPVVAGVGTSPLEQLVAIVDSGSGISAVLDWDAWSFVNVELTVHVAREPAAGWVCLESRTTLAGDGTGLARTRLYDEHGWLGSAAQSLLVAARRRHE